jgi:GNAT superfamily N-acetyltransferase
MTKADLPQAQRIARHAFGTFLGVPDLDTFWTDLDFVYGRFGAEHVASFAAEMDGELVGSNFATRWGSVGFFGPVSVRPDLWDRGIAQPLVKAVSEAFDQWGVSHAGLFTFPHSTKHIWLYQKFGFYPRYLTPVMAAPAGGLSAEDDRRWSRYSALSPAQQNQAEAAVKELCAELYPDLDLSAEIRTCALRKLGDALLLWQGDSRLDGFAVCHWGPASEAGEGCCYVKFGAVPPGDGADARFAALLDACGALARSIGMQNVLAGVNLAREEAYRQMLARGFRSRMNTVTMHRPNEACYSRPCLYVLDDWR